MSYSTVGVSGKLGAADADALGAALGVASAFADDAAAAVSSVVALAEGAGLVFFFFFGFFGGGGVSVESCAKAIGANTGTDAKTARMVIAATDRRAHVARIRERARAAPATKEKEERTIENL